MQKARLRQNVEVGTLTTTYNLARPPVLDVSGTARVWRESFLRVLLQVVVIALVTLLIVRWSIAGPIARAAQWMKALRTGRTPMHHLS